MTIMRSATQHDIFLLEKLTAGDSERVTSSLTTLKADATEIRVAEQGFIQK